MSKWQSIKTAPRDGSAFLSWDGEQCAVIAYCPCRGEWVLLEGKNKPHEDCPQDWEGITHWMPLPEPPK